MRRSYALITVSLILLITFFLYVRFAVEERRDNFLSKMKVLIFDRNNLEVVIDEDISQEKLKIIDSYGRVLFENGKKKSRIKNEYGDALFDFYYDNKLFTEAGHFKTNWWHTHKYQFKIRSINEKKIIEFKIEGPNKSNDVFIKYLFDLGNGKTKWVSYSDAGEIVSEWIE